MNWREPIYFDDDTHGSRALATERIIRDHPSLTAGHLERLSQMHDQLLPASANAPTPPTRAPRR